MRGIFEIGDCNEKRYKIWRLGIRHFSNITQRLADREYILDGYKKRRL